MNCKKEWERDFLVENLNISFVNKTYKDYRANVLMDREKAQFPETMHLVEKEIKVKKVECKNVILNEKIVSLKTKLFEVQWKFNANTREIRNIRKGGETKENKSVFIKSCPADNCKGMLSSAHKCGVCSIWACAKCFEIKGYQKDSPHECLEDNIKSAEMIKKETKSCPGCAASIYKISGCSQMWCTQCKIAFDWKTGEIETGVIHNPHFYQWQKQTGNNIKNPREVPCGGIPDGWLFRSKIQKEGKKIGTINRDLCFKFHRFSEHWQHYEIRLMRISCRELEDNSKIRVSYLMNELTDIEMKCVISKKQKKKEKKLTILHIYELMNTVFTESLVDIYNSTNNITIDRNRERIKKLIQYSNNELARISYIYAQSVQLLNYKFEPRTKKFCKKSYMEYNKRFMEDKNSSNFIM